MEDGMGEIWEFESELSEEEVKPTVAQRVLTQKSVFHKTLHVLLETSCQPEVVLIKCCVFTVK